MKIKQRKYSDHKARRRKRKYIRKSILLGPSVWSSIHSWHHKRKDRRREKINKDYFSTLNKDSASSGIKGP